MAKNTNKHLVKPNIEVKNGGCAALGNNVKSASTLVGTGVLTEGAGEILANASTETARKTRYAALDRAQNILLAHGMATAFRGLAECQRGVHGGAVRVLASREHGGHTHYGGLNTCGSVWACPVCAAKIQARRGTEIALAVAWAQANGKKAVMITCTHPHHAGERLDDLRARHMDALRRMKSGRAWQDAKTALGIVGTIRGAEVTYGANGWHWHTHELWLVPADVDVTAWRDWLAARWLDCCAAVGFKIANKNDMLLHGLDVMAGDAVRGCDATRYIAKMGYGWGIEHEMQGGATKSARAAGGASPFDLLMSPDTEHLYIEYIQATKGRRQLYWSKGLKNLIGINDKTDEELAAEQEDTAAVVAEISPDGWRAVVRGGLRGDVLDVAQAGGFDALASWWQAVGLPAASLRRGGDGGDGGD